MSEALVPMLRTIRQKEFYSEPRFHASIAWALMTISTTPIPDNRDSDRQDENRNTAPVSHSKRGSPAPMKCNTTPIVAVTVEGGSPETPTPPPELEADRQRGGDFETIDRIPEDLVLMLRSDFGESLIDSKVGVFEVTSLCVRVGKEISRWKLEG